MHSQALGRLERVDPRTIWKSESGDFTPWLAEDENLALLGETIGLDLELDTTEKNVGPFRADILCKDSATGGWVLIENQLERTDHSHLGQLLTYAAGLKAVTIVWVANPFTAEHRAALDWLNEVTAEGVNFFGLEVELWRIGTSVAAPKFNVVVQPNDWAESIRGATTGAGPGALTDTKQRQRAYWQSLAAVIAAQPSKLKPQKALPQHWTNFGLGRSNVYLTALVNTVGKRIGAHVALTGATGKAYFAQLLAQRTSIEQAFGGPLEWRELPGRKESQIGIVRVDTNPNDEADWPVQHMWLRDTLVRLHSVFSPRVKTLVASADHVMKDAAGEGSAIPEPEDLDANGVIMTA